MVNENKLAEVRQLVCEHLSPGDAGFVCGVLADMNYECFELEKKINRLESEIHWLEDDTVVTRHEMGMC